MAVKPWTGATLAWGTNTQMSTANGCKIVDEIGFEFSRPEIDLTHFGSTQATTRQAGGREFVPGLLGEVTFSLRIQYDPTIDPPINAADVAETFTITPPSAVASNPLTFSGFVTRFSSSEPLDGRPTASLTIRATGVVSFPSS